MNYRVHRWTGIALLLPLLAWCLTGLVFLIQPGYGAAYEPLPVRSYPITESLVLSPQGDWLELRVLRTIVGTHLLARNKAGWQNLNALTLAPFEANREQHRALVSDAIAQRPERYGRLLESDNLESDAAPYRTSTGAQIRLQWNTLSLQQYGVDTRWIDRLYRVHYLQWTGIKALDKAIGVFGLLFLMLISVTGVRLLLRKNSAAAS